MLSLLPLSLTVLHAHNETTWGILPCRRSRDQSWLSLTALLHPLRESESTCLTTRHIVCAEKPFRVLFPLFEISFFTPCDYKMFVCSVAMRHADPSVMWSSGQTKTKRCCSLATQEQKNIFTNISPTVGLYIMANCFLLFSDEHATVCMMVTVEDTTFAKMWNIL